MPKLRSGLSKDDDSSDAWANAIKNGMDRAIAELKRSESKTVADLISTSLSQIGKIKLTRGTNWSKSIYVPGKQLPSSLRKWYLDESGWRGICNHETRGHIVTDLHRYLFCSCYGRIAGIAPTSKEFPRSLAPNHVNWNTGHFADRYRVQLAGRTATTVTSHISKDGHYFIHYDPIQCRSLTVREAARLQTFPDNYFFVGNRTEQYVQVGNAVPPFLARQIAVVVYKILSAK